MLKILIVEDEPLLAQTLQYLIELNPCYQVVGIAEDADGALAAVAARKPDLALVDLQLANGSTGFGVAAKLGDIGIPCLFSSARAPAFPIPDLALGCLSKPYSEEDLVRTLKTAEDIIRSRRAIRPSLPAQLQIYAKEPALAREFNFLARPRGRPGLKLRLTRWFAAH